jgi:hypothetical protein
MAKILKIVLFSEEIKDFALQKLYEIEEGNLFDVDIYSLNII